MVKMVLSSQTLDSLLVPEQVKTVKVSNVSLGASEWDIKEFFSFSGDIEYVEMQRLALEIVYHFLWANSFSLSLTPTFYFVVILNEAKLHMLHSRILRELTLQFFFQLSSFSNLSKFSICFPYSLDYAYVGLGYWTDNLKSDINGCNNVAFYINLYQVVLRHSCCCSIHVYLLYCIVPAYYCHLSMWLRWYFLLQKQFITSNKPSL